MRLSGGYAPEPEQSTLAMVAHHPQAGYFGMRNGRLLPDGSPDDVIRGTARDPSRFADPGDDEAVEDEVREESRERAASEAPA